VQTRSSYPTLHGRNIITSATLSELLGSSVVRALSSTIETPWTLTLKCGDIVLVNFVNVVSLQIRSDTRGRPIYDFSDVCDPNTDGEINEIEIREDVYTIGQSQLMGYKVSVYSKDGPLENPRSKSKVTYLVIMASDVRVAFEQNLRSFRDRGKSQCVLMGGKSRRTIKK
jgi:hypothetical protein